MVDINPNTEDEALALGLKKVSKDEWEKYISQIPQNFDRVRPEIDCHQVQNRGKKCWEGPCIGGQKGIYFCGGDGECSFYDPNKPGYLVPC